MKSLFVLLGLFFLFQSCIEDEDYFVANGRVERIINRDGVAGQTVKLQVLQYYESGLLGGKREIDHIDVTTDANGNFSALMKDASNISIFAPTKQTDTSSGYDGVFEAYDSVIIKINRFVKLEVSVKNTSPFDSNDYLHISLFSNTSQNFMTEVENFGVNNIHHPADGSGLVAWDETSWVGKNVNSVVSYNVPENSTEVTIVWTKRKNGVETSGVSENISLQSNQVNSFTFEY
ncbi:hypothetical protein [Marivirga harenae]|uniref:hypothetical protein n=1 Tax=Marivirga harenae TaxID=2010992 RepID=UPI0026DEA42B|nr:hypothetical protein [Marivirga harenae]WKV10635.1 hypothetical protein Q3Y49_10450 [Marivirga harenae]|tara:strand:+ start:615933 stop:616631 length:699 start_codon:yes stop_codon:yes gene_type:complete